MEKIEFKKEELKHIEPYRLIKPGTDDPLNQFFLVLAVVFNDLKGIVLFEKLVTDSYRRVPIDELSSHAGEYGGVFTQTYKILVGNIREFLKFLKEKEAVLQTSEFKDLLSKTSKDTQAKWNAIIGIAFNRSTENSDFHKYLIKIRDNVSFHYYQSDKVLKKSFCNYFNNKEKIARNTMAYYIAGDTMESTRFFYADAAVQEYLREATSITDGFDMKYQKEVSKFIIDMNFAIFRLLKVYLKNRPK